LAILEPGTKVRLVSREELLEIQPFASAKKISLGGQIVTIKSYQEEARLLGQEGCYPGYHIYEWQGINITIDMISSIIVKI
jgi:hypothetical protein